MATNTRQKVTSASVREDRSPRELVQAGEALKVNAQAEADEAIARLLANDKPGGYPTYGEIVDTAAFREAAVLICEAHESDGGKRVEMLAQLLIKARFMTAGHKRPLWLGTYDVEDWGRRQWEAGERIRCGADRLDNMPGFRKNKDTIESALERYLPPGKLDASKRENIKDTIVSALERCLPPDTLDVSKRENVADTILSAIERCLPPDILDVSKRENVVELARHGLLGVLLRQFASNIEESHPSEICPGWVHMNSVSTPGITRDLAGKRGKAKVSLEHENRGTLVRGLDGMIPKGVANRNGVIARLATLAGMKMDHRAVGKILEYRLRKERRQWERY